MKTFLFLFILLNVPDSLWAADVPYVPMSLCDSKPYQSVRDQWDQARSFCYVDESGKPVELPLTDMPEIKLREDGKWIESEYAQALSSQNRNEVSLYDKYFVRYLAVGAVESDGVKPFLVQVFFSWGPGTQTIYVFGEIRKDGSSVLTGYSNAAAIDGDLRATWNTIQNLTAVLQGQNPNRVGVDQTKAEDRRRIKPTVDVVNKYNGYEGPVRGGTPGNVWPLN